MTFEVLLSEDSVRDIEDIYRYIAEYDAVENADRVLLALEDTCSGLGTMPERGNVPKELRALGMTEFREAHYKPYRVIYRISGQQVVVYTALSTDAGICRASFSAVCSAERT